MNPLDQPATAERLRWLAGQGALEPPALERALALAGHLPTPRAWARFAGLALLVLGTTFALAGIFFFFAFNWDALHRFTKLGLLAGAVAAATGLSLWRGLDSLTGQVALFAACALVGALLAVFGQIYQTGADSFLLFLTWAALIALPVALGRNAPLWMLLLALLNLSLYLFWEQRMVGGFATQAVALFALNVVWLAAWELARSRGVAWMRSLWYRRAALAVAAWWGTAVLLQVITHRWVIIDGELPLLAGALAALALGGAATFYYLRRSPDLPALSLLALCAIILITAQVSEWIGWQNAMSVLALSGLVVVQVVVATLLLRRAARSMEVAS
jgi:uncharacterized membrane protein